MVFMMASVGLPGTAGFVGEFMTLFGAFQDRMWIGILAASGIVLGATPEFPLYLGGDDKGADEALTASLATLIARHLATAKTRFNVFTDALAGNLARAAQRWIRFPAEIFQRGSTLDDELDAAVNSAMQAAQAGSSAQANRTRPPHRKLRAPYDLGRVGTGDA